MGGMLSPAPPLEGEASEPPLRYPQDDATEGEAGGAVDKVRSGAGVAELELMYDPQLNCFYDPITCKYYELIQP